MHAGSPLTPSVMMSWEIFSSSAIFDKREGQPRYIFQTNIKIFHKLLYYLSFVFLNPNKLQYTLRGCLIQLCNYSFEAKLFGFTEEWTESVLSIHKMALYQIRLFQQTPAKFLYMCDAVTTHKSVNDKHEDLHDKYIILDKVVVESVLN